MPICASTFRDDRGGCIDIPRNCVTWFDGCNTCSAKDGHLEGCTLMMCFTLREPHCQVFDGGALEAGDACYRFCEDGSQPALDRRSACPAGTKCGAAGAAQVSFDSCGSRAHTCEPIAGH